MRLRRSRRSRRRSRLRRRRSARRRRAPRGRRRPPASAGRPSPTAKREQSRTLTVAVPRTKSTGHGTSISQSERRRPRVRTGRRIRRRGHRSPSVCRTAVRDARLDGVLQRLLAFRRHERLARSARSAVRESRNGRDPSAPRSPRRAWRPLPTSKTSCSVTLRKRLPPGSVRFTRNVSNGTMPRSSMRGLPRPAPPWRRDPPSIHQRAAAGDDQHRQRRCIRTFFEPPPLLLGRGDGALRLTGSSSMRSTPLSVDG